MSGVKLNIPYRSQWDPDAKDHYADCGPTALCMILNGLGDPVNPDELYKYIGARGASEYTSFADLKTAAGARSLKMLRKNFVPAEALSELKATLNAGFPFIALVNYAFWDPVVHNSFKGSHFVLVTGYDDQNIYVHDPLFKGDRRDQGRFCKWTYEQFMDAWGGFKAGQNPNYAALMSERIVPFLEGERPTGLTARPAPTAAPAAAQVASPTVLTETLRRRLRAKAAFEKKPDPDLTNPAIVQQLMNDLGHFGASYDSHTVRRGDSLSKIATIYYQDKDLWPVVVYFNDLAHPSLMQDGDVLLIPHTELTPTSDATVAVYGQGGPTP